MPKKDNTGIALAAIALLFLFSRKASAQEGENSSAQGGDNSPQGGFTKPLDSTITQAFKAGVHNGVDIHADENTPVFSPAAGTVDTINTKPCGGNQLFIKHDNGYGTAYAHLNSYSVSQGDRVTQGQQIALTGNTGTCTTAPHLHFVLTDPSGNYIDPVGIIY